ncbi:MAG: LysR substrate-binding domain-containing protein [Mangrovicoccus sp.]
MNAPSLPKVPMLDLDVLQTLVSIAETGSFSAAAAQVGRTPSAVSLQVKKVESLLDRPVFLRDSRSVRLTADGEFLIAHARRMLEMNREALARFAQPEMVGVVRLGAVDNVADRYLPQMLQRFAKSHPGVVVNAMVEDTPIMMKHLAEGRLDLALVTLPPQGDARIEPVFQERLIWAMRRGGTAPTRRPLPVSVWDEGCAWREAGLSALRQAGIPWRIAFQSGHTSGQRAAVLADLAVAPLSEASIGEDIIEAPDELGLPPLPDYHLGLMVAERASAPVAAAAEHLRACFQVQN